MKNTKNKVIIASTRVVFYGKRYWDVTAFY